MPDYLLPCTTCGNKTVVSTAQAGETIRCDCGADLQVPTMRGLSELEPAAATTGAARRRGAWEDRHRGAFLLVLAAIGCLGVAGYLWYTMPPSMAGMFIVNQAAITESFDKAAPVETLQFYTEEMQKGLGKPAEDYNATPRRMMQWGIALVLALAAAALAGAVLIVLRPSGRR